MADSRLRPIPLTLPIAALTLLTACSGDGGSGGRSATLTLLAAPAATDLANVVLTIDDCGDQLDVTSASFRVGDVLIEILAPRSDRDDDDDADDDAPSGTASMGEDDDEEESEEDDDDGDDDDGDDHDGDDDDKDDDDGRRSNVVDMVFLPGPFTFDVATETTIIDSVPVVPGTFDHVVLRFMPTDEVPFEGNSILISGTFLPAVGDSVPVTLRSDFAGIVEVPVADGGIIVTEDSVVPVTIEFDLQGLFANLDLAKATVEEGEILIDATHNVDLLLQFEQALRGCVHARERDDD